MKVTYNVRHQRELQRLSLKQLSELSGVGLSTINDIECNKHHPTIPTLLSLANALNVSIIELFTSN